MLTKLSSTLQESDIEEEWMHGVTVAGQRALYAVHGP